MKTEKDLKSLLRQKDYLIGIDSDGSVYDSMELKHKECFCPAFIENFDLQPVSRYAREVWEFVNLYSRHRGCNRFQALLIALDFLRNHPEVSLRQVEIPAFDSLRRWVQKTPRLHMAELEREIDNIEGNAKEELQIVYQWSRDVNKAVEAMVRNITPFPYFMESLSHMYPKADIIVVSQTPTATLLREWSALGIDTYVRFIAGQEFGTKADHLRFAGKGKYPPQSILMIGDAPGDLEAAKEAGALFYPIIPGKEERSWQRLYTEALNRFFNFTYIGSYQTHLIEEFNKALPQVPAWEKLNKTKGGVYA